MVCIYCDYLGDASIPYIKDVILSLPKPYLSYFAILHAIITGLVPYFLK